MKKPPHRQTSVGGSFFHRMDDHLASQKDRWRHLRVVSGPPDEYMSDGSRVTVQLRAPKVFTGHWRIWQRCTRTPIFGWFFPPAVMKWWQRHLWWTLCRILRQLPLQVMSRKLMRNFNLLSNAQVLVVCNSLIKCINVWSRVWFSSNITRSLNVVTNQRLPEYQDPVIFAGTRHGSISERCGSRYAQITRNVLFFSLSIFHSSSVSSGKSRVYVTLDYNEKKEN